MKTFIPISCGCGEQITIETSGSQPLKERQCPHCHAPIWFVGELANFVSSRIFQRALLELENEDFTLAILLAAMAVECELAYQFVKWSRIDYGTTMDISMYQIAETQWINEWSKVVKIKARLDKASELLTKQQFDEFISNNLALLKPLHDKYPATKAYTSHKDLVQTEFFNKRNRVVHSGEIDYQFSDAEMCMTIAGFIFTAIKAMDKRRYELTWPT